MVPVPQATSGLATAAQKKTVKGGGFDYNSDVEGFVFFVPVDFDDNDASGNISSLKDLRAIPSVYACIAYPSTCTTLDS